MRGHHQKKSIIDEGDLSPNRLQALVDGIFAIAMTLLVFNIHLPELADAKNAQRLWIEILNLWPNVLSFVISFLILGTFWVAHHTEFNYIKKLDHKLIWLNVLYLLLISFFPFTAALLGSYAHNQTAVVIYAIHLIGMVMLHYSMWQHVKNRKWLLIGTFDVKVNTLVNRLAFFAALAYGLAIVISFMSVGLALVIFILAPLPYMFGWIYRLV